MGKFDKLAWDIIHSMPAPTTPGHKGPAVGGRPKGFAEMGQMLRDAKHFTMAFPMFLDELCRFKEPGFLPASPGLPEQADAGVAGRGRGVPLPRLQAACAGLDEKAGVLPGGAMGEDSRRRGAGVQAAQHRVQPPPPGKALGASNVNEQVRELLDRSMRPSSAMRKP